MLKRSTNTAVIEAHLPEKVKCHFNAPNDTYVLSARVKHAKLRQWISGSQYITARQIQQADNILEIVVNAYKNMVRLMAQEVIRIEDEDIRSEITSRVLRMGTYEPPERLGVVARRRRDRLDRAEKWIEAQLLGGGAPGVGAVSSEPEPKTARERFARDDMAFARRMARRLRAKESE